MPPEGPEPSNWELMRGLDRLEKTVDRLGGKVVSTEVYVADKQAADARATRGESRIRDLENQAQDAEKLKRTQRTTIILAICSPLLAGMGAFVIAGGLAIR